MSNNRQSAASQLSREQCYSYKLISSETIQKWSKLQEELKSTDITTIPSRILSSMMNKIVI